MTAFILPSGILTVRRQFFTSSGTYTPHPGMIKAIVRLVGGGGGGGGVINTSLACAAGGGAGGFIESVYASQTPVSVTIGAAGAAGGMGGNGGAGGNTVFGAWTAGGGGGGTQTAVIGGLTGGIGGSATGSADQNCPGEPGHHAGIVSHASINFSGSGGTSPLGGGGLGRSNSAGAGGNGQGYGAGGGGALGFGSFVGGAGSAGKVEIYEFCRF